MKVVIINGYSDNEHGREAFSKFEKIVRQVTSVEHRG